MAQRWGWWGGVVFAAAMFTMAGCGDPSGQSSVIGPSPDPAMVLPIKDAGAGQRDVIADSAEAPADMVLPIKAE